MNGFDGAKRVMNGAHGTMWLDNEQVGECYGLQMKITASKEDIQLPGSMMTDTKIKSYKGTGTMKLYKTNSRMALRLASYIKNGEDPRFTIVSKLDDPDAFGAERVAVKGVSFDDLILADWEAGTPGKADVPFTFVDFEYLDTVGVQ